MLRAVTPLLGSIATRTRLRARTLDISFAHLKSQRYRVSRAPCTLRVVAFARAFLFAPFRLVPTLTCVILPLRVGNLSLAQSIFRQGFRLVKITCSSLLWHHCILSAFLNRVVAHRSEFSKAGCLLPFLTAIGNRVAAGRRLGCCRWNRWRLVEVPVYRVLICLLFRNSLPQFLRLRHSINWENSLLVFLKRCSLFMGLLNIRLRLFNDC